MARILAALSGGVDSSVAAALLKGGGHDVVGVSLQLSDESRGGAVSRCCSPEDLRDARRLCDHLAIPHYVVNEEEAFEREVVAPFVESYRAGRTPNPCVGCNSRLKFGTLLEIARSIGAGRVATGHYARRTGGGDEGPARILKGRDRAKDQSYFLFDLDEAQREAALFPLGEMTKEGVVATARRLGLPNAGKAESQDLCFLPGGDVAGFLEERLGPAAAGEVRHVDGRLLGRHEGRHGLTVGQRRGLGIPAKRPLYVLEMEEGGGAITVGEREHLFVREIAVSGARMHDPRLAGASFRASARIRHRHEGVPSDVTFLTESCLRVRFDEAQAAPTPGQALVLYEGDLVVGGGWIEPFRVGPEAPRPVDCAVTSAERA